MIEKIKLPAVFCIAIIVSGCATMFKQLDPDTDFGLPPLNYEQTIREYFEVRLRDPESARYRFSEPQKAYANKGLAHGGDVEWYGWLVDVDVNAKNSFGGYTGAKPYMVFFKGERIVKHMHGRSHIKVHRLP